ncbi:MAG: M2 family metallopeptidase [Bacteroidetes bacterium]|nr:M2 family metallopeptidase [Bacteroidota bacterium]
MKTKSILFTIVIITIAMAIGCKSSHKENMKQKLINFIKQHDSLTVKLSKEANLASWNAAISGKDEDYAKSEALSVKLTNVYANPASFATLKAIKESNKIKDKLLSRQLIVLYNAYLSAAVDTAKLNAVIKLQTNIEKKFSNFRTEIKGKKLSDNQIEEILKTSVNSNELKETWMTQKKIGDSVNKDIIKLVKMRNEIAKELGFDNYHNMSLQLSEQDPKEIESLFDELDSLTRGTFADLKNEMDDYFAKRYKISKTDLMPWHYQNRFFQEAPKLYAVDLDKYYAKTNLDKITTDYYKGIGLPIDDMIKNSDLYEKPGKNQHAFCTDIDNEGDVRVLCNIKPNQQWMGTMLHEFGHASYDKFIDRGLPFSLREPAHTFTTEAIAMFFGRLSSNPEWLKTMIGITEAEKVKIAEDCYKTLRLEQMVFSRWAQVVYRFEKAMYANPDQDLNKLWWDLVEKYQMLKKPTDRNAPDWATKIHIAIYPCYYHNYLLGELLASQFSYYVTEKVIKASDLKTQSFTVNPEIGKFFTEKVFIPGKSLYWNDMIEQATGEKLTAKYYAKQFVTK